MKLKEDWNGSLAWFGLFWFGLVWFGVVWFALVSLACFGLVDNALRCTTNLLGWSPLVLNLTFNVTLLGRVGLDWVGLGWVG